MEDKKNENEQVIPENGNADQKPEPKPTPVHHHGPIVTGICNGAKKVKEAYSNFVHPKGWENYNSLERTGYRTKQILQIGCVIIGTALLTKKVCDSNNGSDEGEPEVDVIETTFSDEEE